MQEVKRYKNMTTSSEELGHLGTHLAFFRGGKQIRLLILITLLARYHGVLEFLRTDFHLTSFQLTFGSLYAQLGPKTTDIAYLRCYHGKSLPITARSEGK